MPRPRRPRDAIQGVRTAAAAFVGALPGAPPPEPVARHLPGRVRERLRERRGRDGRRRLALLRERRPAGLRRRARRGPPAPLARGARPHGVQPPRGPRDRAPRGPGRHLPRRRRGAARRGAPGLLSRRPAVRADRRQRRPLGRLVRRGRELGGLLPPGARAPAVGRARHPLGRRGGRRPRAHGHRTGRLGLLRRSDRAEHAGAVARARRRCRGGARPRRGQRDPPPAHTGCGGLGDADARGHGQRMEVRQRAALRRLPRAKHRAGAPVGRLRAQPAAALDAGPRARAGLPPAEPPPGRLSRDEGGGGVLRPLRPHDDDPGRHRLRAASSSRSGSRRSGRPSSWSSGSGSSRGSPESR